MDRYKSAKITGILGMAGNIFLLIIKAIAGFVVPYTYLFKWVLTCGFKTVKLPLGLPWYTILFTSYHLYKL